MKKLAILFSAILLISSCAKNDADNQPDCERNNYGYLTVSNSSNNPYDVYVSGLFVRRVQGNSVVQNIVVYQGNGITLRAEQVSGYVFYPTIVTTSGNFIECSTYSWQIP
jgi:hypothetical protein